jgi:hypothetical protein
MICTMPNNRKKRPQRQAPHIDSFPPRFAESRPALNSSSAQFGGMRG